MISEMQAIRIKNLLGDEVLGGLTRGPIDADRAQLTAHAVQRCQQRMQCSDYLSAVALLRHLLREAGGSHCKVLCRKDRSPVREFYVNDARLILAATSDTVLTIMRMAPSHPKSKAGRGQGRKISLTDSGRAAA